MKTAIIRRVSGIASQLLILLTLTVNAQEIKDFNGNVYKTIQYGRQVWTASNLNVSHFRNGDVITEAKTKEEWTNAGLKGIPCWCNYDLIPENGQKYGKLYNWYAINDPRGLAPQGWHLPSNADWRTLVKNLLGVDVAGVKLRSKTGWKSKSGTNDIGFTALPAGWIDTEGKFSDIEKMCQFWSNSVPVEMTPSNKIFTLKITDNMPGVRYLQVDKGAGFSVRCIKDQGNK